MFIDIVTSWHDRLCTRLSEIPSAARWYC